MIHFWVLDKSPLLGPRWGSSFLSNLPDPLRVEEYQRKRWGLKLRKTLWGLPRYRSPTCSPCLNFRKSLDSLLAFTEFQKVGTRNERMQKQRKSSQARKVMIVKQSPSSSSGDIHNNLVLQTLRPSSPPIPHSPFPRWRMVTMSWNPRLVGTRSLMIEIPGTPPCYLTTNQSEESHVHCSPPHKCCLKTFPWKPCGS